MLTAELYMYIVMFWIRIINYSEFRSSLSASLNQVCESALPLFVHRRNADDVVVVSREEYERLKAQALYAGYQDLSNDVEREREANQWCESLFGETW